MVADGIGRPLLPPTAAVPPLKVNWKKAANHHMDRLDDFGTRAHRALAPPLPISIRPRPID